MKLRDAEDRIKQLQAERDQIQDRAAPAEEWLIRIHDKVQEKFFSQRADSPKPPR